MWHRQQFSLKPRSRGFHLVTDEILGTIDEMRSIKTGLLHLQLMHTSASLTLNENADPDVRMPAHVLASLFGTELTLAVERGRLLTGTWQGIWLGEHRERGGARKITATLMGE